MKDDIKQKDKWESCPRCGSKRVQQYPPWVWILGGITASGCGIWLLIIPILGIPLIIIGILLSIVMPFTGTTLHCKDCNKDWKYPAKK